MFSTALSSPHFFSSKLMFDTTCVCVSITDVLSDSSLLFLFWWRPFFPQRKEPSFLLLSPRFFVYSFSFRSSLPPPLPSFHL